MNGSREYGENAVLRVKRIRHLLGCPESLAAMRSRLRRLDDQMDGLAQSRGALAEYIGAAERMSNETCPPVDDAGPEPLPA
ncbi:hypothetical protein [Streptomyces sp. WAC 04229]|uniref:hypothetical protein n=1 Tax=Streptomyces sp. WAC 04229 TaxID=2203206 RepID=UPI001C8CB8F1|nr:hypothetical protein [Streptomyces sp. WAC 04229]